MDALILIQPIMILLCVKMFQKPTHHPCTNYHIDTSCFLHKELGLSESGKPSLSIHSTCLSFMSAFHMCAGLIASGMYQTILIVSAEISTVGLNFEENPRRYLCLRMKTNFIFEKSCIII